MDALAYSWLIKSGYFYELGKITVICYPLPVYINLGGDSSSLALCDLVKQGYIYLYPKVVKQHCELKIYITDKGIVLYHQLSALEKLRYLEGN